MGGPDALSGIHDAPDKHVQPAFDQQGIGFANMVVGIYRAGQDDFIATSMTARPGFR
jgi:hypothetical protein